MAFDLGSILGGNIGELFSKIVGAFKLDPTKRAELESLKETHAVELAKIQLELEAKVQDSISREIEAASANIRAEASSGDKYTSRARPSFMYMCIALLFWNYAIVPVLGKVPVTMPDALFYLFGFSILGYTGARTFEKFAMAKFGMNGKEK